jgi:hypothetical protein
MVLQHGEMQHVQQWEAGSSAPQHDNGYALLRGIDSAMLLQLEHLNMGVPVKISGSIPPAATAPPEILLHRLSLSPLSSGWIPPSAVVASPALDAAAAVPPLCCLQHPIVHSSCCACGSCAQGCALQCWIMYSNAASLRLVHWRLSARCPALAPVCHDASKCTCLWHRHCWGCHC